MTTRKNLVCKTCLKPKDEHHEFVPGGYRRTVIVRHLNHAVEVLVTGPIEQTGQQYAARWELDGWYSHYAATPAAALRSARATIRERIANYRKLLRRGLLDLRRGSLRPVRRVR